MSGPRSSGGAAVNSAEPPRDNCRLSVRVVAALGALGISLGTRVVPALREIPDYVHVALDVIAFTALLMLVSGELRRRAWKRLRPWLGRKLGDILWSGSEDGRPEDRPPDN